MRVLLLAPMPPQAGGGGAIPVLLHALVEGLRERHDVTFVCGVGDEPGEAAGVAALRASGVEVHAADRRLPRAARVRWRRRARLAATWGRGAWPWRTTWFATPGVQRLVDRLTATRAFDVAAVEDNAMGAIRLPGHLPSVLTEHEVRRPRGVRPPPASPADWPAWAAAELDRQRWAAYQREVWGRFDRLQVFTRRDRDDLVAQAPALADRVRVNPFGIVLPALADPGREVPGLLTFVGNFTHPPNLDAARWLATDLLPRVRDREPGARLRIVGTAPPAEVLALAGAHVEVVGDAPSVEPHLDAAAVVLAPVRTGGGMRMKVLQALARGKAVVTTPLGAEGIELGPEAPLVVADDADALAAATAGLLADAGRRRALAARARGYVEAEHRPAAWAARLEAVYAEAAEARRP